MEVIKHTEIRLDNKELRTAIANYCNIKPEDIRFMHITNKYGNDNVFEVRFELWDSEVEKYVNS